MSSDFILIGHFTVILLHKQSDQIGWIFYERQSNKIDSTLTIKKCIFSLGSNIDFFSSRFTEFQHFAKARAKW